LVAFVQNNSVQDSIPLKQTALLHRHFSCRDQKDLPIKNLGLLYSVSPWTEE